MGSHLSFRPFDRRGEQGIQRGQAGTGEIVVASIGSNGGDSRNERKVARGRLADGAVSTTPMCR